MNTATAQNIIPSEKQESDSVTPAMRQYLEVKSRHADCMLFYRMGDFYELFFDDAVQAASILDIALTKRGKHNGDDIPMCGVPVHSHEAYLEKLIRAGVRVAICEQLEDPAEAKKRGYKAVIQRDVVRIITAGTITEENLLDARQANYLAAIVADSQACSGGNNKYILSWLDISTGEFNFSAASSKTIAMELARINPRELIIPEELTANTELQDFRSIFTPQPANLFEEKRAERLLKEIYNVASIEMFGDLSGFEIIACGVLLDYVRLTQKANFPRLDTPRREHIGEHMLIDSASQRNLEIMSTLSGKRKGSLFSVVDKTVTAAGARMLAAWLSAPQTSVAVINGRLDNVQLFVDQQGLCGNVRGFLKECPDIERALSRLCLGRGGARDALVIASGLYSAQKVREELELQRKNLPEGLFALLPALSGNEILIEHVRAAIKQDAPILIRDGNFIRDGYNAALDELRRLRDDSQKLILSLQQKYIENTGIATLKIRFNNMLGYFAEITAQHQSKITQDFIHRQTLANNLRYSTVELSELERKINDAAGNAIKLEQEIFAKLLSEITTASEKIIATARALAQVDVAAALAYLAVDKNYVRPKVEDSLAFDIVGGRHPVVEDSLRESGGAFMGNGCNLENGQRLWLLTGPNMAGKSTFLRQNALIAILAQAGSFVPAESATIGIVDRLFSRVGAADDLARGHSTFMVEMVETATILHQASNSSLVILDEIGRGTATFDGLSIAWAVVEHLHNITKCRGLFATHYHELTELVDSLPSLSCHTMKVKEWKGDLIFLHEVAAGSADRSYGIHVARLAGLPATVINRAADILHQLEKEHRTAPQLAESLPLFSYAPPPQQVVVEIPPKLTAIAEEIKNISPDNLTPKQALEILYRLKEKQG